MKQKDILRNPCINDKQLRKVPFSISLFYISKILKNEIGAILTKMHVNLAIELGCIIGLHLLMSSRDI